VELDFEAAWEFEGRGSHHGGVAPGLPDRRCRLAEGTAVPQSPREVLTSYCPPCNWAIRMQSTFAKRQQSCARRAWHCW